MKLFETMRKSIVNLDLKDEVRIYVCGITAYDYSHIGHARSSVIFDTLRRFLEFKGHRVIMVQNFTDIDDKIIRRALEEEKIALEISDKFIKEFLKDAEDLNLKECIRPKVSDYIPKIIEAVGKLIEKGFAYKIKRERGYDVYFHVPKFESYGKLSGFTTEEMNVHRIEPDPLKKDPRDFALWKAAKDEDIKVKSYFDSPWGLGRPGWHIECSVMSSDILGVPFDIHGGGKDLIFPHHENERAQSYALFGVEPVRYWIHNDFITVKGEKMSKSLGNIIRIRDVVEKFGGLVLRYFLLTAHYSKPLDYSEEKIREAKKSYDYLINTLRNLDMEIAYLKTFDIESDIERDEKSYESYLEKFVEALENDFNTPKALSILHSFAAYINKRVYTLGLEALNNLFEEFYTMLDILGLIRDYKRVPVLDNETKNLIVEREKARKEKNFKKADEIRDYLKSRGLHLIDTKWGTRWFV